MMHLTLLFGSVVLVNACFALAASNSARKAAILLDLRSARALSLLAAGTLAEAGIAAAHTAAPPAVLVPALSGVFVSAATDAVSGYVFDSVTIPASASALLLAAYAHALPHALAGAVLGVGALGLLHVITGGRGLGLGDVKLASCMGAALGAHGVLVSLGAAFVGGGMYAAFLLVTRRAQGGHEVYFAPYLAAGVVGAALIGAAR